MLIHYFFYLGINWNWKISFLILSLEIKGEKKYGISTTGIDSLKKLKARGIDISHATMYMPVSYHLLDNIFRQLSSGKKHFLDIGCGKGRALCVAAFEGYEKVTGIDFSNDLCIQAEKNLRSVKLKFPNLVYSIENIRAEHYAVPADADCIFLFNPFDEDVMKLVLENICRSLIATPRSLQVIYVNPLYKQLFTDKGFKELYHFKSMTYFEISLMNI